MAETQVVLLYYIFQQRDLGVHMLDMSLSRKEDSSSARLLSWYQTVVPVPDCCPGTRLLSRYQTLQQSGTGTSGKLRGHFLDV